MRANPKKLTLLGLLLGAVALLGAPAVHAQLGIEYGASTGLANTDIRTIIGRIIQVGLGLLGVVALVLIIYAGFLWMTAGGDEEKVTTAKRILTQAVIGLAIILSAFAITTFVVNALYEATTGNNNGCVGPDCNPGGGLDTTRFSVQGITPPDSQDASFKWPKNSHVTVVLRNGLPDPATVANSISVVTAGAPVEGIVHAEGNALIFIPTAVCTENNAYNCLPGDSDFTVTVSPSLVSTTGKALFCGQCSAAFSTGNYIDIENPTVSIVSPSDGAPVPVDSSVPIIANAHDDSVVAMVEFYARGVSLGTIGAAPWQIAWETLNIPIGTVVPLQAKATDVVGNTALSAVVNVIVRPAHCFDGVINFGEGPKADCGDDCGACSGESCTQNSDCASGLCRNGVCINQPRIDSIDPLSGGPGTLTTISGTAFGGSPGHVVFLGGAGAGDDKEAQPCAPSAWSNSQIIVSVPEGAVSGPIQVTNTDNLSDSTDDTYGLVANFVVNTTVNPGICTLTPDNGPPGTQTAIGGIGFGDAQGASIVTMAGRPASVQSGSWSGTQIGIVAPNLLGGRWPVQVVTAGATSNMAAFTVPGAGSTAPHLGAINPEEGPIGEYVTITGSNFGNTPGKVEFVSGTDHILGDTDFPPACGTDFWRDDSVTVKVPAGLPQDGVKVSMIRADATPSDNSLDFDVVAGNPNPGICRLSPAAGPVGVPYEINGERLGSNRGHMTFWKNVDATTELSAWDDGRVAGTVPAGAATGGVFATSADAKISNSLIFKVADCRQTPAVCIGSEECCDDGACREPNADGTSGCTLPRRAGSYLYRFSTGDIPIVPAVIEDISCSVSSQSPTPWKSVTDACVNSTPSVRFNIPMNPDTLRDASNTVVLACGSADNFDAAQCSTPVAGTVAVMGGNQASQDGLIFQPTGNGGRLTANEWYQVTIKKTVRSLGGLPMNDDYVWHFRVRNSAALCDIGSVTVSPASNWLIDIYDALKRAGNENKTYTEYKANPASPECYLLDCEPYDWSWTTDQNFSAQIVSPNICTPEVRALKNTPVATPATISATAQGKTGNGSLVIKSLDPQVIDQWPSCQKACLEAQVAASFNTTMLASSISANTVKIFSCNNETCLVSNELGGYSVSSNDDGKEHLAVFHSLSLQPNTFYRVIVVGGTNGVHSLTGADLVGTNYVYGADHAPSYMWYFRTSDQHCVLDSVTNLPASITTNVVGSYHPVTAVPQTAADACSPDGERIDPDAFNFAWSFAPPAPGAADLYAAGALNAEPLVPSSYATSSCLNTGTQARAVCGNSRVENGRGQTKAAGHEAEGGGEECDLGARNGQTGSGCSANCLLIGNAVCKNAADPGCCGNGTIDTYTLTRADGGTVTIKEQCDLGNQNGPNSGCSASCLREGSSSGQHPAVCGNGDLADNEQCDLGPTGGSGSGCSDQCFDEGSAPGSAATPICGNSLKESGEDCDLGANNGKTGSGCGVSCLFVGTSLCTASGQTGCCGNGNQDAGEAPGCDLGWDNVKKQPTIAAGCNSSCLKAGASLTFPIPSVCGDKNLSTGETNDPGASGTNVDATQYAHAVGGPGSPLDAQGRMVTTIAAKESVSGKTGQTTFYLQCGFKDNSACPAGTYLGSNSCCYPPPTILSHEPTGINACRNPLIQAVFDRAMNSSSFIGKFTVTGPVPPGGCPKAQAVRSGFIDRLWAQASELLKKAYSLLVGLPAAAQAGSCVVPGTVKVDNHEDGNGIMRSYVTFVSTIALEPLARYDVLIDSSVKSIDGVPLGGAGYPWNFTTGKDICTLDAVNIDPPSALLTAVYANRPDRNAALPFTAHPVHLDGQGLPQDIAPLPTVYDWKIDWASSEDTAPSPIVGPLGAIVWPSGSTVTAAVKRNENGEVTLQAGATITVDKLNASSTVGNTIKGTASITVLICKNPWPARQANVIWRPAYSDPDNGGYGYSFYYCRDAEGGKTDLPALLQTAVVPANTAALKSQGNVIDQLLYTYDAPSIAAEPGLRPEGVGFRIVANPYHFSPTAWYLVQGFKGTPSSVKVDGYEALKDGTTVYISAPTIKTVPSFADYTNIFALSYPAGSGSETQNIYNQIVKNIRFAANRDANGQPIYYDLNSCANLKVCSHDGKTVCTQNSDCSAKQEGSLCNSRLACVSDLDCSAASSGTTCEATRSKIRRDVKRVADLSLIAAAANNQATKIGVSPQLASGSFLAGRSVSVWPSWNKELSLELGGSPPVDPVNRLGACPTVDYETLTCWLAPQQTFACPANSLAYQYVWAGSSGYSLNFNEEYFNFARNDCSNGLTAEQCRANPLCYFNGACASRVNMTDPCHGQQYGVKPNVCGNGIVENGEDCEKTVTPLVAGNVVRSSPGTETITCQAAVGNLTVNGVQVNTCGLDCSWLAGACQVPKCGNGQKEGNEACDSGVLNGTYGHCNASCTGPALRCGDGIIQQGESCDCGVNAQGTGFGGATCQDANGVYGSNCSLDCHSIGDYCGDNKVSPGNEDCDGNSESSPDANGTQIPACSVDPATGRAQTHTRTCGNCRWNPWGACEPIGTCGNGVKETGEQCDLGESNSDNGACLATAPLACHAASCGDAKVWIGHEQCDEGANNLNKNDPTDRQTIIDKGRNCSLASCYYCSNTCTTQAVTGAYCGDGNTDTDFGEQCDQGAGNIDPKNKAAIDQVPPGSTYCTTACQQIVKPRCGDNKVDSGEQCDIGDRNGVPNSGCGASCQCAEEVYGSGIGDTQLLSGLGGSVIGTAFNLPASWTRTWSPGTWATLPGVGYVWGFDESLGNDPADWQTVDNIQYFRYTFNLAHATSKILVSMSSDNGIDNFVVDGTDVTDHVPGGPMASYATTYVIDITPYLLSGMTHTLEFRARNAHIAGTTTANNPAMLTFRIVSTPNCSGKALSYQTSCGNGIKDPAEECDGGDFGGKTDCKSLGSFDTGSLSCNGDCTFDLSQCQSCSVAVIGRVIDSHTALGIPNQGVRATCGGTTLGMAYTDNSGSYRLNLSNGSTAFSACSRIIKIESESNAAYCYDTIQAVSVDLTSQTACLGATAIANSLVLTSPVLPGQWKAVLTWDPNSAQNLNIHMREANASAASPGGAWSLQHVLTSGSTSRYCLINGVVTASACTQDSDCPSSSPCVNMAADNGNAYLDIDAMHGPGPETITVIDHDDMRGGIAIDGTGNGSGTSGSPVADATLSIWTPNCHIQQYKSDQADGDPTQSWWWAIDFYHANGQLAILPHGGVNGIHYNTCVNTPTSTQPPW